MEHTFFGSSHILPQLEAAFQKAANKIFENQTQPDQVKPEVIRSKQKADYQTALPLVLAKSLQTTPREVGEQLIAAVQCPWIDRLELAGPGFINIYLKNGVLEDHFSNLFAPQRQRQEKVLVDYSSPNVAKELHVGHLRSTIIGDAIANLFAYLGYTVLRINHIGDFGTQFGMLVTYILDHNLAVEGSTLADLMEWYRSSKVEFDRDPVFKKRAQEMVVRLQAHEEKIQAIWKAILAVSRQGFSEIYRILDVNLLERGESFYQSYLGEIVGFFEQKGLVKASQGAKCIFLDGYKDPEGEPLPMIIEKSDGGYNYATTDLAALRYRVEVDEADRIIYVIDAGQSQHIHMVFDAAKLGGILKDNVVAEHAAFGLVLSPDGTKMKTRSGEVFRLIDLIQEAVARARAIIDARYQETIPEKERAQMAQVIGVNAIKYADLSAVRTKDYVFSFERMLRFEGNTAAFNLYAYVRIQSILKKCTQTSGDLHIAHPTERKLVLTLYQLYEVLEIVARDLMPHRIAEYLYHLSETFNEFFRDCRVEGVAEEPSRIALLKKTANAFEICFSILGLKTLSRM